MSCWRACGRWLSHSDAEQTVLRCLHYTLCQPVSQRCVALSVVDPPSSSKTVRQLTVHLPLSNISVRSRQNSSRSTSGHLTSQHGSIFTTRRFLVVPRRLLSTLGPRPTGLLCGRPVALELSTRQLERSGSWQKQLQMSAEDAFIYT